MGNLAAERPLDGAGEGDFGGYLRRNLAWGYRLAAMCLGDPVAAQDIAHRASLSAWLKGGRWPDGALDLAFSRTLEAHCIRALRAQTGTVSNPSGPEEDRLAAALGSLSPADRLALAREFGLSGSSRTRPAAQGRDMLLRLGSGEARASASGGDTAGDLEARLRAVYASRDPGDEAPLGLRLRLQQSLVDAEKAAAERDEIARRSGWGFALNVPLLMVALTAAIAVASVTGLRASQRAVTSSGGGPTMPLTITSVTLVRGGIVGSGVSVAATRDSLMATFEATTLWHPAPRQCLPDVSGTVDGGGQARWLGQRAGHVQAIAGDPNSDAAYAFGLGEYCEPVGHSSTDGGNTWTVDPPPPGETGDPVWLAFDPANAGTLVIGGDSLLLVSRDAGRTWASTPEMVAPLGFDAGGRLYGWSPGVIFESTDDGMSWQPAGAGPATRPTAAAALAGGILLGGPSGLWWFPADGPATLLYAGLVYALAPAGDGAVAMGSDSIGRPWLGTYSANATDTPFHTFSLPPQAQSMSIAGGQIAANNSGAAVVFAGSSSAIYFVDFAR
jgi:hypothetical protein